MLKIKDNVDLKELEKFGFVEIKSNNVGESMGWRWSAISMDDGYEMTLYIYPDNSIYRRRISLEYDGEDKLFDLIQAGLVEKVNGE